MAGDDDLVPLSHTAAFFAGLPEAQLAIVPGASHALPIEHPKEVVGLIERFLGSDVRDVRRFRRRCQEPTVAAAGSPHCRPPWQSIHKVYLSRRYALWRD